MTSAPLFSGIGGHQSARSRTDEWLTPPEVIAALGGADSFDLDPCSPIERPWPTARRHLTIVDNGLIQPWDGRVWLNPPYSTSVIGQWLARLADHNRGVALIFARTETDAFFRKGIIYFITLTSARESYTLFLSDREIHSPLS